MKKYITKATWLGLALSVMLLVLCTAIGTTLLYRGILAPPSEKLYLVAVCAVSSFAGALLPAKSGERRVLRAIITAAMFYLLIWLLSCTSDGQISFNDYTWQKTAAIFSAAVVAGMIVPPKKRKNVAKKGRREVVKSRKRLVT